MSIKKILFINGAPRSGKDTLSGEILNVFYTDPIASSYGDELTFKQPLIDAVAGLFGIDYTIWWDRYESDDKDKPWAKLEGMSQREALIWMSEKVGKPKFGRDFFGKAMINMIEGSNADFVIIPDSGFLEETQAVVDHFGNEKCHMINVFRDGTNFDNDSRSLVTGKDLGITGNFLMNNGTLEDLKANAEVIYKEHLG